MTYRPDEISRKVFLTTLRGYDRAEVEQFLTFVAEDLAEALEAADDVGGPVRPRPRHAVVEAVDPYPVVLCPLPAADVLVVRRSARGLRVARVCPAAGSAGRAVPRAPAAQLDQLRQSLAAVAAELAAALSRLSELERSLPR